MFKEDTYQQTALLLNLSTSDYMEIFQLQKDIHALKKQELIPDVVIMLEHWPCFTIGRSGSRDHLLVDNQVLTQHNITVHDTSRGGDITYHGPGQLVCYPIISLEGDQRDLHAYARKMEEVMIRTLSAFDIKAGRKQQFPGVWVGDRKIGAMGIAVRNWITMHGISLNVCPDLEHFSYIIPCGITSYGVTSMSEIMGEPVQIEIVRNEMCKQFSAVFDMPLLPTTLKNIIREEKYAKA
ncbi:lipoyl(octanoyl) transferase LipB [Maridesulfovibrio sp.]|uniref:lipoyl(octanoyl) transferase LipB n=1 Tax=Maridesulfovibrio sp. TaxID=2795000 RepID=UPI0029C9B3B4|nr:lipoyl(octanoyl) transferase LipB [Maridesulfovibrio sp.]